MLLSSWFTCRQWLHRRVGARRSHATRRRGFRRSVSLEALESRELLSAADLFGSAIPLTLNSDQPQLGSISQTPTFYSFNAIEDGRLTVEAAPTGGTTRLSLLSSDGELLMQSDGQSPTNPIDHIDIHLHGVTDGLTYYLKIEGLSGAGSYTLTTDFVTATAPFDPLSVEARPWDLTTGDFNGDGVVDLASANPFDRNVSVMLGLDDGTFAHAMKFATGNGAWEVVTADFNGDGRLDLATPNLHDVTVSILLGRGDGTFGNQTKFSAGLGPRSLSVEDMDGDGRLDLGVGTSGSGVVTLRGRGDGTFESPVQLPGGLAFANVAVADLNGDGRLDIAGSDNSSNNVSIFLRQSDGTFAAPMQFGVGDNANDLIAQDFNGDGYLDLATANANSDDVSVLLGRGDGTFADQVRYGGSPGIFQLTAGDLNRDGVLDLATINRNDGTISILLGRDDGTFADAIPFAAGDGVLCIAAADFNGDGSLDLAAGSLDPRQILIFSGRGDGTFHPGTRVSSGSATYGVATGDFNGDGRLDFAAANHSTTDVSILLGQGDGTFRSYGRIPIGIDSLAITSGDFNGDGQVDLAVASLNGSNVLVMFGEGDGTFGTPVSFAVNGVPLSLVAGDFNSDGRSDLATSSTTRSTVSVLLGRSDGTFEPHLDLAVGIAPYQLTAGDFNGDGRLDIATSNLAKHDVSVLLGRGNGTFENLMRVNVETPVGLIAAGDFNGDGRSDLAVAPTQSRAASPVSVLLALENGTFALSTRFTAAPGLDFLTAGDFDGDGHAELLVPEPQTSEVTQYRRQADGTFQVAGQSAIGAGAFRGVIGDFNGDGHPDFAVGNQQDSSVSVLLNHGNGQLHDQLPVGLASGPAAVTQADFDHDGTMDLVTVNPKSGNMEVSLGNGDGTLQTPIVIAIGGGLRSVATEDFNQDGRPDIAIADELDNTVSVLLGVDGGSFKPPLSYKVGVDPLMVVAGDFNRDGIADLATSDYRSGTVSILLGQGDGTFLDAQPFRVGDGPTALTVSDLNRDGQSDLIVANSLSRNLSLLIGLGKGAFRSAAILPLGAAPGAVATGDFNSDGTLDIAVTNPAQKSVSILLGGHDGAFQTPVEFAAGTAPGSLAVGDFNRDGQVDIATENYNSNNVTVLLGQGDGTFLGQTQFDVGRYPAALITGDFNDDGRLDLATVNGLAEPISVGLGLGNGTFAEPGASFPRIRSKPLIADFNYDGMPDVVSLRNDGKLLFRAGSGNGSFEAPMVINPDSADGIRDVSLLTSGGVAVLIAINAHGDSLPIYTNFGGQFFLIGELAVPGILPSQILVGDVNGDGLEDGVIPSPASGKVFVYLQKPDEDIASRPPAYLIDVGSGVSDVKLVDVNGDGLPEIVATDQVSGDVRVLLNSATAPFTSQLRFRAGAGLLSVVPVDGSQQIQSRDASIAVVAGLFNDDAYPDLAVLNQGMNRVDILLGDGQGGMFNPTATTSLLTGRDPVALVAADFNGDGRADLAVLNKGSDDVSIFLKNDHAGFTEQTPTGSDGQRSRINAGNSPTGLTVRDVNGDGQFDLLLGNEHGDVLTLLGNGNGSFRPYQRIDRHVGLAVTELGSNEGPTFAIVDQSLDRVTLQSSGAGLTFQQGREDGLLAPSAVRFADLNADGIDDLIVSNSGSNEIRVYLGLGNDQFGRCRCFFVGTDPAGITVSDLNDDGLPDLVVANFGSNDLSLLFGQRQGDDWTMTAGSRLRAGRAPIATAVQDMDGDGVVDILVANQESDNVFVLTGVGRGFFNDKKPVIYQTGDAPAQLLVGHFDNPSNFDVATLNEGSGDVTVISPLGEIRRVSTGGDPVAALTIDFNADGLSDLIVADRSGQFGLWLGGSDTTQTTALFVPDNLTDISQLAIGRVTEDAIEVYLTREGQAAATSVIFALNADSATTSLVTFQSFTSSAPITLPLPFAVPATFSLINSTSSTDGLTNAAGETIPRASLFLNLGFIPLPKEMPNGLVFSDSGNGPIAEFSSASGSQLEIITTLLFGSDNSSYESAISEDEAAESEGTIVAVTDESTATDRLITGAEIQPIQQHLRNSDDPNTAATEILFQSPLDLFDVRGNVAMSRAGNQAVDAATFGDPRANVTLHAANSDHAERLDLAAGEFPRAAQKPGLLSPNNDLSSTDPSSDALSPQHLGILAVCFASIPVMQESLVHELFSGQRRRNAQLTEKRKP